MQEYSIKVVAPLMMRTRAKLNLKGKGSSRFAEGIIYPSTDLYICVQFLYIHIRSHSIVSFDLTPKVHSLIYDGRMFTFPEQNGAARSSGTLRFLRSSAAVRRSNLEGISTHHIIFIYNHGIPQVTKTARGFGPELWLAEDLVGP